jgi:hypothetical protein
VSNGRMIAKNECVAFTIGVLAHEFGNPLDVVVLGKATSQCRLPCRLRADEHNPLHASDGSLTGSAR